MGQGVLGFDENVRAMFSGLLLGNICFVDGTYGDNNSSGIDWGHAVRDFATAQSRCQPARHDYILCANPITQSARMTWSKSRLHVIGASFRDYGAPSCKITTPYLGGSHMSLAASNGSHGMEFAGLHFYTSSASTSEIQVADGGSGDVYFHDCIFEHNGESGSPPICMDIETADWTIRRCNFINVAKAIDSAARIFIYDNHFFTASTAAIAINLSNTAADRSVIARNVFNLGGGSSDKGIVLSSNVIACTLHENWFSNECSDPITVTTDTDQMISANFVDTLIAANTSSTILYKGVQT